MKLLVIGASRGIGRATVVNALAAGHTVTALARHVDNIDINHQLLTKIAGDANDPATLGRSLSSQDVVVIALGLATRSAIGPPFARKSYVLTQSTKHIIEIMHAYKIKRLICVTAIGLGDSIQQCSPLTRFALKSGLPWLFKQKAEQEELMRTSGLDWTIIRPTALTNGGGGPTTNHPKHTIKLFTHISRQSVAETIVQAIADNDTIHQAVTTTFEPRFGDTFRWVAAYVRSY